LPPVVWREVEDIDTAIERLKAREIKHDGFCIIED
jgi:hypothetical protein